VDKPLNPRRSPDDKLAVPLENFTRVETFGAPYHHWVQITVDESDSGLFTIRPRLVAANLSKAP